MHETIDMSNAQNTVISGIHFHSQKVEPGFVFVAIRGFSEDGNQYVQEAIASGAVAIIGEDKLEHINGIPYISDHRIVHCLPSAKKEAGCLGFGLSYDRRKLP